MLTKWSRKLLVSLEALWSAIPELLGQWRSSLSFDPASFGTGVPSRLDQSGG